MQSQPQVHPNDVFYECNGAGDCGTPEHYLPGQQWALNKVGAPQAWKYTTGSKKVKVRGPCRIAKDHARLRMIFVQRHAASASQELRSDDG